MRTARKLIAFTPLALMTLAAVSCSDDDTGASSSSIPSTTSASTTTVAAGATTIAETTTVVPTTPIETTTTAAPTTTPAPTTTTTPPGAKLPLRFDGIGDVRFGTDPDDSVAVISGVLGAPTSDSGWVDAASRTCPGSEVRFVKWGDLTMEFSDDSSVSSGRRHFFAWVFGPAAGLALVPQGMKTPEGIGIGSTVAELRAAYPAADLFTDDELAGPYSALQEGLLAFLSDPTDTGVVTSMVGGQGCGE
jgi:hypothetical protein